MKGRILLVEDDETFRSFVQVILEDEEYEVRIACDGREGGQILARENFDLVITDLKMPGKSGLDLFRETRQDPGATPFVFLTAFGTVDEAVSAMKDGAVDFLTKPLASPEELLAVVSRVIDHQELSRTVRAMKEAESTGLPPEELIFAGLAMQSVRTLVRDVAKTTANVLLLGESGTGKELIARTVHLISPRGKASFIPINCAAIPENLLESELFGHEKGAFTGAIQARLGKFELANGGTIFLDEIGEMPLPLQSKLLRVLQERVFERVGGSKEIRADVRVIAATNRNLMDEVAEHRFREDLYYRLNVFPIQLPPLKDRVDAIPLLAGYFLNHFSSRIGKKLKGFEKDALTAMEQYAWPGNVRELQNVVERAVILAQGTIRCFNLPDIFQRTLEPVKQDVRDMLKTVECEMLVKVLDKHKGNRRLAAEELGFSRRALQYKLKEYRLLNDS